jgi:hypothetical protein
MALSSSLERASARRLSEADGLKPKLHGGIQTDGKFREAKTVGSQIINLRPSRIFRRLLEFSDPLESSGDASLLVDQLAPKLPD